MTTGQQSYDPYQLITDVTTILQEHGLTPTVAQGDAGMALGGAGTLLRALGISPLMDSVTALKLSTDKIWSEWDDDARS